MLAIATTRSKPALRRLLDGLLSVAAAGISAASILAAAAPTGWLPELFAHFRLQQAVFQGALLIVLLGRRRWIVGALVAALAVPNVAALAPYWPRHEPARAGGAPLTVMTANVWARNDDYARLLALVRREHPDVLLLVEIDAGWSKALDALASIYPHRIERPREGPFGIALLSRLPLAGAGIVDLLGTPAVDTRIRLADGRSVRLLGVHLQPPTSAERAATRNAQLEKLRGIVVAAVQPLIVTGDLNVTPYSPTLTRWLESTGLRDVRRGRGFGMTWPTTNPLLRIPIDHCLVSEHFMVGEQYQGPAFGSDHFPVLTRLYLRGNE